MLNPKRDIEALRQDLLCVYLVLRELHEYGPHYGEALRAEMVGKALASLKNAWRDTGADERQLEPQMLALLASGQICQPRQAAAE